MPRESLSAIIAQHPLSTPALAVLVAFAAIGATSLLVAVVRAVRDSLTRPGAAGTRTDRAATPTAVDGSPAGAERAEDRRRVILAGYGLVGRVVAEQLDKIGVAYTIVEMNPRTVERQTKFKKDIRHGNICHAEVLEDADVRTADAVIITIPDDQAALRACEAVREISRDIFIAVRTTFLSQATLATEAGADHVTVEEVSTAQAMAAVIAERLGKRAPGAPHAEALRAADGG